MNRKLKPRHAFAAIMLMSSGTAAVAFLPAYWDEYEYYSDSSHGQLVGIEGETCNGHSYSWGNRTAYRVQTIHEWCDNTYEPNT